MPKYGIINNENKNKTMKNTMKSLVSYLLFTLVILLPAIGLAANTPTFSQIITGGTLAVDIVDNTGTPVGSPTIAFADQAFSFDAITSTGRLGDTSGTGQVVRTYVPNSSPTWTVSLAASGGPSSTWTSGGDTYDFNDTSGATDGGDSDSVGGQLTWSGGGSFVGVPNNTACPVTGLSIASSTAFAEGSVDSVNILTNGTGTNGFCRWDYSSGVDNLSQEIPAAQPGGTYTLPMTLTIL